MEEYGGGGGQVCAKGESAPAYKSIYIDVDYVLIPTYQPMTCIPNVRACQSVCLDQFSSRLYLRARKSSYVLHPVSAKFPQFAFENSSNVRCSNVTMALSRPFKENRVERFLFSCHPICQTAFSCC